MKLKLVVLAISAMYAMAFDMKKHHDQELMEQTLIEVNDKCPKITRLYSLGESVEGRLLPVIEFSTNPGEHDICKCIYTKWQSGAD